MYERQVQGLKNRQKGAAGTGTEDRKKSGDRGKFSFAGEAREASEKKRR